MSQPDVVLDIVDQMRELSATCGYHGSKKILDGGAAEIERLRAALLVQADENERLRAELETCRELREYDRKDLHTREQMLIELRRVSRQP